MKNERHLKDEIGNTEEDREALEEIKGRSSNVCQEHYDRRSRKGVIYTDEIVSKEKCALCNHYQPN